MFMGYCHLRTEGARLQGWMASERGLRVEFSVAERRGGNEELMRRDRQRMESEREDVLRGMKC